MKKILSMLLVLSMLFSAVAFSVPSGAVTYGYLLGDANDDGQISMKDVLLIRKYLVGLTEEKDISLLAADADKNGSTTMGDVLIIRQILLGLADDEGNNTDNTYKVDTITVDSKNISRYTIVVTDDSNACMVYSARELQNYIRSACGVTLNITTDESSVEGYKIKYLFDTEDEYGLGKEGYRVTVDKSDDVIFYCGSMRGPLYATYYFLEELVGYRFLFGTPSTYGESGDSYIYLYEAENVNIPQGFDETEVPVLSYRATSQGGESINFAALRNNAGDGGAIANAKYGWVVGTLFIHAHSYAYQCGVGFDEQPCLTKEETYNQIVEYNTNLINQRASWTSPQKLGEYYTQISCSPNDNTNFCMCSNCKAVYTEEGSIAGTIFRLANRVAEKMDEVCPGIEVYTIAYWDARNPPKLTRPSDNVCVCFCFSGCNNHPYDDVQACLDAGGNYRLPLNTWDGQTVQNDNYHEMEYFKSWTELTNNIYTWYYSASFSVKLAPAANLFNVYNDIKAMAEYGAIGIYSEGASKGYTFENLRGYLISKMLWNPFMSEEEFESLLNEYLELFYGDGWEYVREYIDMSNYASDLQGCWTNNYDRPFNIYNEEYFRENYDTMHDLFDKAIELATPEQKNRLEYTRMHCEFLGLSATYESDYVNGDAESREKYVERYQWLYNFVVDNNIDVTPWGETDFGPHGCANFPTSEDKIMNPMRWIMENYTGYWEYVNGRWV